MHFNIGISISIISKRLLIFVSGLFFSAPTLADIDEIYHLSIGTNIERYNSQFSIDSNNQTTGAAVDFEDDLGYDSKISTIWISGWYRVGDLHRIRMTYTPLVRSARSKSTKDLTINNAIIKAGATFSADTKTDILDFSYIYSFHKSQQLEMGISAGIYWLSNNTNIQAAGEIQTENEDQPSFKSDYFTNQKIQAPMPLIGASAIYQITDDWRANMALRYLSVQFNDTDGRIASAELGTEYYFNENWGAGLSINYFDLDIKTIGLLSNATLGWSHNGLQIYAAFKY